LHLISFFGLTFMIDTFVKSQKMPFYLAGKGFPSPAA